MPSPASKLPRSADAILAGYLEQRERQLSGHLNSGSKRTNSKTPYKLPSSQQLDCRNLLNSPAGQRQQEGSSFFPHPRAADSAGPDSPSAGPLVQVQRKLLALFYIYVTIIVSLYLTYAVYCYYQQSQFKRQQQQLELQANHNQVPAASLISSDAPQEQQPLGLQELQSKLEGKIGLLERYIELLAVDLEAAKARLSEREKCACSIGCSFNGTKYADRQTWAQKCDVCRCETGKISCQPRACPKLSCQNNPEAVIETPPGQCCPSCMKMCKVNKMLVRHGHTFKPMDSDGQPNAAKQCKCLNGLIKCEPLRARARDKSAEPSPHARGANKTMEYLRSILGSSRMFVLEGAKRAPT